MQQKEVPQEEITKWFNATYQRFGLNYLRPVEAYQLFLELMKPLPGSKILDVACGPGQLLLAAKEYGLQLYGIDIAEVAVGLCRQRLPEANVQCGNAEHLPFDNNTFDSITCLGSIERFIDRKKALSEQYRVAKPGAYFCYMVRNANNFKWKFIKKTLRLKNTTGHQDALNLQQWRSLFSAIGFEEINVLPDHWPALKWAHYFKIFPRKKVQYKAIPRQKSSLENANEFIFLLRKN
jgi:ubiquinone/menaquinone biosynthesis C-methylase UbiE